MLIQALRNRTRVGPPYHELRQKALSAIAAGTHIEVASRLETTKEAEERVRALDLPGTKRTEPSTVWSIRPQQIIQDYAYGPEVNGKCQACGASFRTSNSTERITSKFPHFASCNFVHESVPESVLKLYEKERDEFTSRRGRAAQSAEQARQKNEAAKKLFLASIGVGQ